MTLTRWPRRRYSGRSVYRAKNGLWYAQCDLCGWPARDLGASAMQEAFWLAQDHATRCPGGVNEPTA